MEMESEPTMKDTYGVVVDPKVPRHEACVCEQPCQKRFRCRSRHHPGARPTPYCLGGEGQSCNPCWWKELNRSRRENPGPSEIEASSTGEATS